MGAVPMDSLIQELRYVLRGLARAPAFTLTAVLIIALGIAMNTTAFTIYDAVALRPLAVLEPRDLVRVVAPVNRSQGDLFPYDTYDFLARSAHSFSGVVATSAPQTLLAHAPGFFPDDIPVSARFVSLNYFPVLG